MPFNVNTVLKPDVDWSFTCPGDETERCGAGDRLALYQNSAGIPPDPSQCITWRASVWAGRLRAVNRDGTGSPIELWNYYINDVNDPVNYNIISVS
ncbi:hypothetical protein BJ165DRAFT_1481344 [Panaeolus papilionaceus]|nr:hypothetical protein BJ165DRAFT_1481344 [Panaeolus papilionaceus]